jgi:hypothetical protein
VTRTRFDREVDVAIAKREPCKHCGGTFSEKLGRIYHEFGCRVNQARLGRKFYSGAEQTHHSHALRNPDACVHNFEDWRECPGCTSAADEDNG